jgi:hypothetical protein
MVAAVIGKTEKRIDRVIQVRHRRLIRGRDVDTVTIGIPAHVTPTIALRL